MLLLRDILSSALSGKCKWRGTEIVKNQLQHRRRRYFASSQRTIQERCTFVRAVRLDTNTVFFKFEMRDNLDVCYLLSTHRDWVEQHNCIHIYRIGETEVRLPRLIPQLTPDGYLEY